MTRRKCDFPGCGNNGRNKGLYKGKTRYDHVCEIHHRKVNKAYYLQKQAIDNSKCQLCGWDKAPCDRHRIEPSKGYYIENIAVLCPNCHRLVSMRLLKL